MEIIVAYPQDKETIQALKAIYKALKVKFEVKEESPYNAIFVQKIKEGEEDIKNSQTTKMTLDEIWK